MPQHVLVIDTQEIAEPQWPDIERAAHSIGTRPGLNTVRLTAPEDELPWLTIGGRLNDRYSVSVEPRPRETWILLDLSEPDQDVEVFFPFGEFDIVSKQELVALSTVLQSARYYFETQQPDPRLAWRKFAGGKTSIISPQP